MSRKQHHRFKEAVMWWPFRKSVQKMMLKRRITQGKEALAPLALRIGLFHFPTKANEFGEIGEAIKDHLEDAAVTTYELATKEAEQLWEYGVPSPGPADLATVPTAHLHIVVISRGVADCSLHNPAKRWASLQFRFFQPQEVEAQPRNHGQTVRLQRVGARFPRLSVEVGMKENLPDWREEAVDYVIRSVLELCSLQPKPKTASGCLPQQDQ